MPTGDLTKPASSVARNDNCEGPAFLLLVTPYVPLSSLFSLPCLPLEVELQKSG